MSEQISASTRVRAALVLPAILLAAVLLSVFVPLVAAQEPAPTVSDDEVNAIAKQMFCPVCENVPLDVCPTQACAQWRETIRRMLGEGKTEQEIKDYFVLQYGDRVLAEPPRRGFNILVYVIPPVVVVAGALLLLRLMRQWQTPSTAEEAVPPTIADDEFVKRLEEELKRRD